VGRRGPATDIGASFARGRRLAHIAARLLDIGLALLLLVLTFPVIATLAIVIKLDSRGPVFYRCRRVGYRGRAFEMLKLRKMVDGASGPALTTATDARLTRSGRMLAATKLDELPQLWHVLRGQMSLVGPRPEDPAFVSLFREQYEEICGVKPGITGLCQLAFKNEGEILDADEREATYVGRLLPAKVQIDLLYARNKTILMDLRVLFWTAVGLGLRKDIAVHRGSGRMNIRRRPRPVPTLALEPGEAA
jgi:lipopolysaccharide/colanic/teichoic acid biosynthesis glycosyltransferase